MSTDEEPTLDLTPQKPPLDDLRRIAFENVMAQREEVLRAFIAKYGLLPDKDEVTMEHRRFLTRAEAAQFLSISPATLANFAWRGCGPPIIRLSGRCVRYDIEALIAWAKSKEEAQNIGGDYE